MGIDDPANHPLRGEPAVVAAIPLGRPRVFLPVGLPSSGKSTWAREQIRQRMMHAEGNPATLVRLSRDELRQALTVDYCAPVPEFEDLVSGLHEVMLPALLRRGIDVIMDETSLNPDHMIPLLKRIERHGVCWQMVDFTSVNVETCIQRDQQREAGRVGENVIRELAEHVPAARYMLGAFGVGRASAVPPQEHQLDEPHQLSGRR